MSDHTAWEQEHLGWVNTGPTTEAAKTAEIAAYAAANRAACGVCPGVECWCDFKPPAGIRLRRTAGTTVRGHTGLLRPLHDDEVDYYEGRD